MKKLVSLTLAIVVLALFSTSCKKFEAELSWYQVEGNGYYDETTDTSSIKVEAWIKIEDADIADFPPQLSLLDWKFDIFSKEGALVMQIAKSGYHQVVGDALINTSDFEFDFLWVYIETTVPKSGDIFNGGFNDLTNPNLVNDGSMTVTMIAQDDDGNFYDMQAAAAFTFEKITAK